MEAPTNKISSFSLLCINIGFIIGAGIFTSLPIACTYVGSGIVLCFVVAFVESILRNMPSILPGASIPCNGGFYMHMCRLVHPIAGYFIFIDTILMTLILTLLGTMFAVYVNMLFPANQLIVAMLAIIVFGVIGCFGLQTGAKVQNILVILLIVALGVFIVYGMMSIDSTKINFKSIISPEGMTLTSFGAALGMMTSALGGGFQGMILADNLENPRKQIISSFILSTSIVAIFYAAMGVVTVGVNSSDPVDSLGAVAKINMPTAVYLFFIVCGALFALATTINGMLLTTSANLDMMARDKLLPSCFAKKNRFGQNPWCIIFIVVVVCGILVLNIDITLLMSVSSVLTILSGVLKFLPVLKLPKRYPHCYKNAMVRLPQWMVYGMIFIAFAFCVYEGYSLVVEAQSSLWWGVLATLAVCFGYFLLRVLFVKKKTGENLLENMAAPYKPWEEMEATYAAIDNAEV